MADVKIKWNQNWKRELSEIVTPVLRGLAAKRTLQYEKLVARHRDGDINTVKAELVRLYRAEGGKITDPELTDHAKKIVAGTRIVFKT